MKRKRYKRIECADGFSMSVQASSSNYSDPRADGADKYTAVEVGFPNREERLLNPYMDGDNFDPTDTVYAFVPAHIIVLLCAKHGGIVSGELPPGIPFLEAHIGEK
tara:strand:+ start:82 stop:399 length:318 start_codon:yes stop_codon:yes gene_type:complete